MKRGGHVEIHGDAAQVAARDFTVHNHFWTSGYPAEGVPEAPWWELPTDQLEDMLRSEQGEFWRAWRRYWFNIPGLVLLATLIGVVATFAATVQSGGPFGLIDGPQWLLPLGLVGCVCVLTPTGIWMHRIRRMEGIALAQAQEAIDGLEAVLTRRKRMRR